MYKNNFDWELSTRFINGNGYLMCSKNFNGVRYRKLYHVYIWEKNNGFKPKGHIIHHIDENKLNNDISNLQLVTRTEHARIHAGWKLIDNEWWKPCTCCGELKNVINNFNKLKNSGCHYCKSCQSIYNKNYGEKNRVIINSYNKNYYKLHKEDIKERDKLYYEKNREQILIKKKEYYLSCKNKNGISSS